MISPGEWIPEDIWLEIAAKLAPFDALSLGQTCRRMRSVCSNLPCWEDIRKDMRRRPPSKRPYKLVNSFRIVITHACFKCRCKNRMRDLPLCSGCLHEQHFLHGTRQEVQRLQQSIQRREKRIVWFQRTIGRVSEYAVDWDVRDYVMKLIDTVAYHNGLIVDELRRRDQLDRCFHDSLLDHRL